MTTNDPAPSSKVNPLAMMVRTAALDKAVRNEKPSTKDVKKSRGSFSGLVHKSPDTYNLPSRG